MTQHLHQSTVLVLNSNWLAVASTSPAEVFGAMINGQARGLDIHSEDQLTPLSWDDWCQLPILESDRSIGMVRGRIRIPTVVVLSTYNQVPRKRLRFGLRGLWERDGGRCQYSGRQLTLAEANIDHVIPSSRGGSTSWENCVISDRNINTRKADRTPAEAGLALLAKPARPPKRLVTHFIRNKFQIKDWRIFLPGSSRP
ncbi:HNH endonuclease [Akkermansiaceae bacterium]|nr:HNH endonuclease [Akkermansiaceae bacterium]